MDLTVAYGYIQYRSTSQRIAGFVEASLRGTCKTLKGCDPSSTVSMHCDFILQVAEQ